MAKKDTEQVKFDSDFDLNSGPDLDFDGLDFMEAEIKDDRKPVVKAASAVPAGALKGLKEPSFLNQTLKNVLPTGYTQSIELGENTIGTAADLYDTAMQEINPVLKEFKRVAPKVLPKDSKFIPKSIRERVDQWEKDSSSGPKDLTIEQQRESVLSQDLFDIFKSQTEQNASAEQRDEEKSKLQEGLAMARHKDLHSLATSQTISLDRINNYYSKIDIKYKKKSLEVQFRTLFTLQDILNTTRVGNVKTQESLLAVAKNTALPEFIKLQNTEHLKEVVRTKFYEQLNSSLFGSGSDFLDNIGKNIKAKLKSSLSEFKESAIEGLQGVEAAKDQIDSLADLPGMDKSTMTGEMIGSTLSQGAVNYLTKKTDSVGVKYISKVPSKIKKVLDVKEQSIFLSYLNRTPEGLAADYIKPTTKNERVLYGPQGEKLSFADVYKQAESSSLMSSAAGLFTGGKIRDFVINNKFSKKFGLEEKGVKLENEVENVAGRINDFKSKNYSLEGGLKGTILPMIQDLIPGTEVDRQTNILTGKDMFDAGIFTKKTDKAITEIIPGFLSRILREVQVFRTGITTVDLVKYDYESNRFTGSTKLAKNILSKVVNKNDVTSFNNHLNSIVEDIETKTDKKLDPNERAAIRKVLTKNSIDKRSTSVDNLTSDRVFDGIDRATSAKGRDTISKYMQSLTDEELVEFSKKNNRITDSITDTRNTLQNNVSLGNLQELRDLNLVNKKGEINVEGLVDYYLKEPKKRKQRGRLSELTDSIGPNNNSPLPASPLKGQDPSSFVGPNRPTLKDRVKSKVNKLRKMDLGFANDLFKVNLDGTKSFDSKKLKKSLEDRFGSIKKLSLKDLAKIKDELRAKLTREEFDKIDFDAIQSDLKSRFDNSSIVTGARKRLDESEGFQELKGTFNNSSTVKAIRNRLPSAAELRKLSFEDLKTKIKSKLPEKFRDMDFEQIVGELRSKLTKEEFDKINFSEIKRELTDTAVSTFNDSQTIQDLSTRVNESKAVNGLRKGVEESRAFKFIKEKLPSAEELRSLSYAGLKAKVKQSLTEDFTTSEFNKVVEELKAKLPRKQFNSINFKSMRNDLESGIESFKASVTNKLPTQGVLGDMSKIIDPSKQNEDVSDLYVEGETYPRIRAAKLLAGKYKERLTGKVLRSLNQIGNKDIVDENDNVVMTEQEIQSALKMDLKTRLFKKFRDTKATLTSLANEGVDEIKSSGSKFKASFRDNITSRFARLSATDVYVKGDNDPRMYASKIKQGHYTDKESGDVINNVYDIKGEVIDENNNTVISKEDIPNLLIYEPLIKRFKPLSVLGKIGRSLWHYQTVVAPKWTKWNFKQLGKLATMAKDVGMALIRDRVKDVYVGSESQPRLYASKIKNGDYFLRSNGEVINHQNQITDAIVDGDGNVVISYEELENLRVYESVFNWLNPFKLAKIAGKAIGKGFSKLAKFGLSASKKIFSAGFNFFKAGANLIAKTLVRTKDVYLRGKVSPVLLAKDIMAGRYYNADTGEQIKHHRDITGAVVDEEGNIVLTKEQTQSGLYDVNGNKLNKGILVNASRMLGKLNKLFSYRKKLKNVGNLMKNPNKDSGEGFSNSDVINAKSLNTLQDIKEMMAKRFNKGNRFGDADGDGDRDNSFLDKMRRKKAKADKSKDKRPKDKENKDDDAGSSFISKALGMLPAVLGTLGSTLSGAIGSIGTMFTTGTTLLLTKFSKMGFGLLKGLGKGLLSTIGKIPKLLSSLPKFITMLPRLIAGYAIDGVFGMFGVGKDEEGNDLVLDEEKDDANWDKLSGMDKIFSGAARGIEHVGEFFFLDNIAREAANDRIKYESELLAKAKEGEKPSKPSLTDLNRSGHAIRPNRSGNPIKSKNAEPTRVRPGVRHNPRDLKSLTSPHPTSAEARANKELASPLLSFGMLSKPNRSIDTEPTMGLRAKSLAARAKRKTASEKMPANRTDYSIQNTEGGYPKSPSTLVPNATGKGYAAVKDTIMGASEVVGVPTETMMKIAGVESSYDPKAKASTSSASGLFQFIKSTWNSMLTKFGHLYGYKPGSTSPFDARANALMGAHYVKQNFEGLESSGLPTGPVEAYLTHFLGLGGGKKFLREYVNNPNKSAARVFPRAAASNKNIFYTNGRPNSLAQVYDKFDKKLTKAAGADVGQTVSIRNSGNTQTTSTSTPEATSDLSQTVADVVRAKANPFEKSTALMEAPTASSVPDNYLSGFGNMSFNQVPSSRIQQPNQMNPDVMKTTENLLSQSVDVQKKMLEAINKIHDTVSNRSASGQSEQKNNPVVTAANKTNVTKGRQTNPYETPNALVSMGRGIV